MSYADNAYQNMNDYINDHNIDTPIHAAVGIGGYLAADYLLPEEIQGKWRVLASWSVPVVFSLIDECFNKNFNINDVGEVASFAAVVPIVTFTFEEISEYFEPLTIKRQVND